MSRTLVVRLLLTAVAVVCEVLVLLRALGILSPAELPFAIDSSAQDRYVIEARSDWPLPPALLSGDVLAIANMAPADRAIVDSTRDVRPDVPLHLAVLRQGRLLRVSVTTIPAVLSLPHEVAVWIGGFGLLSFVLVLSLIHISEPTRP